MKYDKKWQRELLMNVTIWCQLYFQHIVVYKSKFENVVAHEESGTIPKEMCKIETADNAAALRTM